jgi:hypothetical protein
MKFSEVMELLLKSNVWLRAGLTAEGISRLWGAMETCNTYGKISICFPSEEANVRLS